MILRGATFFIAVLSGVILLLTYTLDGQGGLNSVDFGIQDYPRTRIYLAAAALVCFVVLWAVVFVTRFAMTPRQSDVLIFMGTAFYFLLQMLYVPLLRRRKRRPASSTRAIRVLLFVCVVPILMVVCGAFMQKDTVLICMSILCAAHVFLNDFVLYTRLLSRSPESV